MQLQRDWGTTAGARELFRAGHAYLQGNTEETIRVLTALQQSPLGENRRTQQGIKLMLGDIEGALDDFEQLLSEGNFFTVRSARGTAVDYKNFPDWFAHPRYHQIMADNGLDNAAVAKLKLQPLNL